VADLPDDHRCPWRDEAEGLRAELDEVRSQLAAVTFLTDEVIAYRFAPDRSGETPLAVLGGTRGTLVVDAYTGYNRVVEVDGRSRSSCLAHVRRRFFEALTSHSQCPFAGQLVRKFRPDPS